MAYSDFHTFLLYVHAHLELHVFDECLQNTVPLLLQWRDSVSGHWHAAILRLHAQILNRDLSEINLVSLIFVLFNRLEF